MNYVILNVEQVRFVTLYLLLAKLQLYKLVSNILLIGFSLLYYYAKAVDVTSATC